MTSDDRIADLERHVADLLAYNQTRTDELAASVAQVSALTLDRDALPSLFQVQDQLAASQLREQKLREDLKRIGMGEARNGCIASTGDLIDMAYEALTLPTDDTALQARLAEERERCAKAADDRMGPLNSVAKAIRSMT